MKTVTYRGTASRATIGKDQWSKVGVSSKDVEWSGYGDSQEVADAAADYLAANDSRFEVAGSGDGSAYAKRLRTDKNEQVNRERVGTSGGIAPESDQSDEPDENPNQSNDPDDS